MKIVFVCAGPPERKIVVDELPALIGRDSCAEICLEDSWVGHLQCIIEREGDKLLVLDLGSRNGTFINGVRIKRADLMPGDILTVGRSDFVVHYERDAGRHPGNVEPTTTTSHGLASTPAHTPC
jgi:two-component system, NtrC family, sensor kinase